MFVLKGFISHSQFASNALGVVAPIGEISTQSLTYAREIGLYKSTGISTDISLTTFMTAMDAVPQQLTQDIVDHAVTIAKHIYDRSIAAHGEIYADELLNNLIDTFGSVAENFACGEIVNDGTVWMPEWLEWKNTSIASVNTSDNAFKVWFADTSFQNQYDEYEIVVVPPFDNLDNFFRTGGEVDSLLSAITPSETMNRIQLAKNGYPETVIRAETYDYVDPYNADHKVPATWNVLIYGNAGNNIDAIADALINYILAHSAYTRDDWIKILPDLFRHTEFVIVPLWDQYAIPNRDIVAGIYSPITNLKRALALIKQVVVNYPGSHIDENVDVMSHPYKSLSLLAVGSPDNRNDWFKITDLFPDYINVSSTSIDFNRMSQTTQGWVNLLNDMLIGAEKMGFYTSLPVGMTKTVRNGVLYLVKRYGTVNYLIAAKVNTYANGTV